MEEVMIRAARGQRHIVRYRWEVVYDPEGYLTGRYLPERAAVEMLESGDFYASDTKLYVSRLDCNCWVNDGKLYYDEGCTIPAYYPKK